MRHNPRRTWRWFYRGIYHSTFVPPSAQGDDIVVGDCRGTHQVQCEVIHEVILPLLQVIPGAVCTAPRIGEGEELHIAYRAGLHGGWHTHIHLLYSLGRFNRRFMLRI